MDLISEVKHLSSQELEAGLEHIRQAPKEEGRLMLIVRRPAVDAREAITEGELNPADGLVGDTWKKRGNRHTPDGAANIEAQITLMNARVIALLAQSEDRWALAGDQLYVDMDLSEENLPPGTRLSIGSAIVEISAKPHTGCAKFSARFGVEAHKFVNSPVGKPLRMRGVNARVIQAGTIRTGDIARKIQEAQ